MRAGWGESYECISHAETRIEARVTTVMFNRYRHCKLDYSQREPQERTQRSLIPLQLCSCEETMWKTIKNTGIIKVDLRMLKCSNFMNFGAMEQKMGLHLELTHFEPTCAGYCCSSCGEIIGSCICPSQTKVETRVIKYSISWVVVDENQIIVNNQRASIRSRSVFFHLRSIARFSNGRMKSLQIVTSRVLSPTFNETVITIAGVFNMVIYLSIFLPRTHGNGC